MATASLAFAYDFPWLARVGLLAPLLLLLWQAPTQGPCSASIVEGPNVPTHGPPLILSGAGVTIKMFVFTTSRN